MPRILPAQSPGAALRSTLWMWDVNSSRYRINWKYLYNMRRRLESNWELGKYTTFQLPHPSYPEEGHQECVYTLQFDTNFLVSGSRDRTMRIWNIHTRRLVRPPLSGHSGSVLCLQFDADPEEDILVSGSSDSNVFIWKFSTGELIQKITSAHRESVLNVRFDKRILVTSSKDKTIKIFNRRPLRHGDLGYPAGDAVSPAASSVKQYGYEPDLSQQLPIKPPYTLIGRLNGHSAAVNAIQVRNRTIVSVSGDRHIKVWNWPEQVCVQTIPAHDKGIACVEFDERRIVSGSSDYEVCIFDAPTGLKVASLRGHAHLVRTVQAGFGDLPYSRTEDEEEAKSVDADYFRAVEAGEIDHESERRYRRSRRVNAGSSRPADVQAFGAKVPPGGGGGKKYGRIVSGSYDQSIIVWRRDKEGVWKPAHHLRQEEAAEAAQRQATQPFGQLNVLPSQAAVMAAFGGQYSGQPDGQSANIDHFTSIPPPPTQDVHGGGNRPASLYMSLIDEVVPLGAAALQQALGNYPSMLAFHTYLQAAIEREPSPFVRSQLRQAVARSLVAIQNRQLPRQQQSEDAQGPAPSPGALDIPNQSMPAGMTGVFAAGPSTAPNQYTTERAPGQQSPPSPQSNTAQAASMASAAASVPAQPGPAVTSVLQPPQPAPAQIPGNAPPHAQVTHHPHINAAENAPARVFKLQFDARKIVCCSQAPVIVGWDFCNGDPELEEASRFFATVD